MSETLAKVYDPEAVEPEVRRRWADADAFHATPDPARDPYVIVIPPPNVTAALHMGHALNNTLQDVLVRWHRMRGDNTVWIPGTDHAGIATQTVVEKRILAEEGIRRTDMTRDAFVARTQAWKDEYEARILEQLDAMGCSCDGKRTRFTMDEPCAAAVREAFFRLFEAGLIYRGKRLVNWDPVTGTALADDEVEQKEIDSFFYYLRYPEVDAEGNETGEHVTVATTRPETMLGDTAVAVNGSDPERARWVGRFVRLPIVNRVVPVIADDYVVIPDPESDDAKAKYASGFLKVTPAHDPNDWEIGLRHGLLALNVMAPDASISKDHGWPAEDAANADPFLDDALIGKGRYEARKAVVEWFERKGLLAETRPYRHGVGHSYRSHAPIEPYLSDQWYVKVTDDRLAGAALRALVPDQRDEDGAGCVWKEGGSFGGSIDALKGAEAQLRFYPKRYARTFQSWHENIRDWCISRQLWWGHRIPVWSKDGEEASPPGAGDARVAIQHDRGRTYVCVREEASDLTAALEATGYQQDPDVLDTWFSSALWPISTLGWPSPERFPEAFPEGGRLLERWNPSSTLCTAREIITLWVSRMVMFNVFFRGCLPFTDVFIHAMIQDGEGQKMSKSLGNGVDPLDIIHSHGADAMRFTLAAMTTETQDLRLPVSPVCPHTGEAFEAAMITTSAGHRVMAPTQASPKDPSKRMVTSYGLASGTARPSDREPLARNTSPKFDYGRNFVNKLWNAGRFALGKLRGFEDDPEAEPTSLADRWILTRVARTVESIDRALAGYQFSAYAQAVYDLFWRELCDWYLEAIKPVVGERTEAGAAARRTLASALDAVLRLLQPIAPFVSDRLFTHLGEVRAARGVPGLELPPSELMMHAAWPKATASLIDEPSERAFEALQAVVTEVRNIRGLYNVPPRDTVRLRVKAEGDALAQLERGRDLLETLAGATVEALGPGVTAGADAATAVVSGAQVFACGLIDPDAERRRLEKRVQELEGRERGLKGRLSNKGYVDKAPAHLVQETRDQLAEVEGELQTLRDKLGTLVG